MSREATISIVFVIAISLLRLLSAPSFGYGVDEAHYMLYARYLDISYFDHPPLVGWVHYLFSPLGTGETVARIPAILLGAIDSFLIFILLRDIGEKAAFWGVVAVNASFVPAVLFLTLMPDSLLITTMLLLLLSVKRLVKTQRIQEYIFLGLCFGLAGLSKYTGVLFVPAFALFIIYTRRFDIVLNAKMGISFLIALLCITPVIIWNIDHQFLSFSYQATHVSGGDGIRISNFFLSLGRQFAAYNPLLFIVAGYGFIVAIKRKTFLLERLFGGFICVFMLFSQFRQIALPHWISPFFVLFIPIGVAYLYTSRPKTTIWIVSISLFLTLCVHIELLGKFGTFPDEKSPFRDIYGWDIAAKKADVLLQKTAQHNTALGVANWSEASRLMMYSSSRVYVLDSRFDQFDLWQQGSPIGKTILFVNPQSYDDDIAKQYICKSVRRVDMYDARLNGGIVERFYFDVCEGYGGLK